MFGKKSFIWRMAILTVAGLPASGEGQNRPPEEEPKDVTPITLSGAPMATIVSGDLRVTMALPDPKRGFYRSTRFDWSGMITEVRRGSSRFYGPWMDGVAANVHDFVDRPDGVVAGPRNAATGPSEEFANRDGETVPGYDAAPAGGSFIKIGVGRLRKPDLRPYDHFAAYSIVDSGKWTVRRHADRIVFEQRLAPDASGYGFDYEKTVSVAPGGVMVIAHRLRNTGSKPIQTQVYNHNFARFDGAEVGSGVSVAFPWAITGSVADPRLAGIDGNVLRYLRVLSPGERVQLPPMGGPTAVSGPFRVTGANGASIEMQSDVPLVRTVLWSMRRVVAVEPFVAIDVAPGSEQRWTWRYSYTAGSPQVTKAQQ